MWLNCAIEENKSAIPSLSRRMISYSKTHARRRTCRHRTVESWPWYTAIQLIGRFSYGACFMNRSPNDPGRWLVAGPRLSERIDSRHNAYKPAQGV
jgi:hypothetical protein